MSRNLSVSLIALLTLWTAPASADLITYTVQTTVGSFDAGDPLGLAGSTFTVEYEWDAAPLTPDFDGPFGGADRVTLWPNTNLGASLTIAGSTSADGSYVGQSGGSRFQLTNNDTTPVVGDSVQFPGLLFDLAGEDVEFGGLLAFFPTSFNTPAAPGTVVPYPFEASDVTSWQAPSIVYPNDFSFADGANVSGSAVAVPEPTSLAMLGLGGLLIGASRRRI